MLNLASGFTVFSISSVLYLETENYSKRETETDYHLYSVIHTLLIIKPFS